MIKLLIHGASGTMGKVLAAVAQKSADQITLVGGVDRVACTSDYGFPIFDSFESCKVDFDVIIDFSLPAALEGVLAAAIKRNSALVIATTGLTDEHRELIAKAAKQIPIFIAANMSLGVNLQMELVRRAAAFLGDSFDIEIIEKHHNQKIDAPSGTALMLANAVSAQFAQGKKYVFDRHSTREKRNKNEIGFSSVRGGTVVGEHEVLFLGEDEILEIKHTAQSKRLFAVGALKAAAFIYNHPPKLYSMSEILSEQTQVTGIHTTQNQSILSIKNLSLTHEGFSHVFDSLANAHVNIDMINMSVPHANGVDVSFTLACEDLQKATDVLRNISITHFESLSPVTKCCVQGDGMEYLPGVAAKVFHVVAKANIEMKLVSTSETKISFCLDDADVAKIVALIANSFDL